MLYAVEKIQANRKEDEEFRVALRGGDTSMDDTMIIPEVSPTEVTMPLSALTAERLSDERLSKLTYREAIAVGSAQIFALLPGISRSGITIVGGLLRGLKHEDAARFAFLLATPVILAAGIFKVPELLSPEHAPVPRPGPGRQHHRRCRRVLLAALPGPLLRNQDPDPVRDLLRRRRCRLRGVLRHRPHLSLVVSRSR